VGGASFPCQRRIKHVALNGFMQTICDKYSVDKTVVIRARAADSLNALETAPYL